MKLRWRGTAFAHTDRYRYGVRVRDRSPTSPAEACGEGGTKMDTLYRRKASQAFVGPAQTEASGVPLLTDEAKLVGIWDAVQATFA